MGTPIHADLIAMFPKDLQNLSVEQFNALKTPVELFVDDATWADDAKCKYAKELLIAHLFKVESLGGGAGGITSKKVGQLSVGFGSSVSPTDFDLTSYGKLYKGLVDICFPISMGIVPEC